MAECLHRSPDTIHHQLVRSSTTDSTASRSAQTRVGLSGHGLYSDVHMISFSDALIGIIATAMVLQFKLKATNEFGFHIPLEKQLLNAYVQSIMYLVSFFLIMSIWLHHCRLFRSITLINDVVVHLNSIMLLVTAALPFVCSLMAAFPNSTVTVVGTSFVIIVIGILQCILFLYVANHELLGIINEESVISHPYRGAQFAKAMGCLQYLAMPLISLVIVTMSACWPQGPFEDFYCFFFLAAALIFPGLVRRLIRVFQGDRLREILSFSHYVSENFHKERMACVSDSVFGVAATLIVLSIDVPDSSDDLLSVIMSRWPQMTAFASSFWAVCMLWFLHMSFMQHIVECSLITLDLNILFLASVGLIPFASSILSQCIKKTDNKVTIADELIALRFVCVLGGITGVLQLLVWVSTFIDSARFLDSKGQVMIVRIMITIKLCVIPVLCIIAIATTFIDYTTSVVVLALLLFSVPFLLALIQWRADLSVAKQNNNKIEKRDCDVSSDNSDPEVEETTDNDDWTHPLIDRAIARQSYGI